MEQDSGNLIVRCGESCKNSPKKELLKKLTVAFVINDKDFWAEHLKNEVIWDITGVRRINGKTSVEKELNRRKQEEIRELQIHNIITHGNTGAVNGVLIPRNGENLAFCDVYHFSGHGKKAKSRTITSYIIPVPPRN